MLAIAATTLLYGCAAQNTHWGYSGLEGPSNWAALSPDNSVCSGKNQSPINVSNSIDANLPAIQFNYKTGGHEILNNGHTVQVNYQQGSSIHIDGTDFMLLQFHFHTPSENNIHGLSYPLEAHFVHTDNQGNLAVVAVMFTLGTENKALSSAWLNMPQHAGDIHQLSQIINANTLLPSSLDYYRFNGSLTTPPCSEGVRWFVMKNAITISAQQIDTFSKVLHEPNNRPLQPINARTILR